MGALHHKMKNMNHHKMQQIIIYLNKQIFRVLFPFENQGVTVETCLSKTLSRLL
jgi:hypothetical protein